MSSINRKQRSVGPMRKRSPRLIARTQPTQAIDIDILNKLMDSKLINSMGKGDVSSNDDYIANLLDLKLKALSKPTGKKGGFINDYYMNWIDDLMKTNQVYNELIKHFRR